MPVLTINALKDTFTFSGHTSYNYGLQPNLLVGKSSGGQYITSLMFDLSSIPSHATIHSAKLNLHLTKQSNYIDRSQTISIMRIVSNDWSETGITWNMDTSSDGVAIVQFATAIDSPAMTYTVDITSLVDKWVKGIWSNKGMRLLGIKDCLAYFVSKDDTTYPSQRPALVVDFSINTKPTPPAHVFLSSEGATYNGKPQFYFDVSDPDGDQMTNIQLQVATTTDFSSGLLNNENMLGEAGYGNKSGEWAWLGFPANSGGRIIFTPPSGYGSYPPGVYYMRARVKDSKDAWSDWSVTQQFRVKAVPWSDTLSGGPGYKAKWLNEIYACIKDYRLFRRWGTAFPMEGAANATKTVRAFSIMECRKYLSDVLSAFSPVQPVWSTPELTNLFSAQQSNGGTEWSNLDQFSWYFSGLSTSVAYDTTDSANPAGGWACIKIVNKASGYFSIYTGAHPAPVKPNTAYTSGVWVKGTAGKKGQFYGFYRDATNTRTGPVPHVTFTFDGTWQFVKNSFRTQANTACLEIEVACIDGTGTEVLKWGGGFLVEGDPFALDRDNRHILELRNYITKA